ncbi:MAG: HflC protein [Rhizobiales bacterium 65-9]|nr:protease modulator HflC [Hyphomicrobiales bacterium]OJY38633.1 MAG: HflC protein [Rhizobiales bacterium 65-9]
MNSALVKIVGGVIVAAAAIILFGAAFTVSQTQYGLVLRFGETVRTISNPGLYFKWPLIDAVLTFDKRILDLDRPAQEVIASDQKRIVVDTFTRYRVDNPLLFYQTMQSIEGANRRLASIVDSTLRGVIGDATFTTVVKTDRDGLMQKMRSEVNQQAKGFGIEIVDVRIRRADLPEANQKAVFQRMQTERQREAADIRAQGQEQSLGIRARADREVATIRGEANQKSEELRGAADAERNAIFAAAFGKDPDFFTFYRSMQAYETGLKAGDTRMVLSPDSDFFRYFSDPAGRRASSPTPAN